MSLTRSLSRPIFSPLYRAITAVSALLGRIVQAGDYLTDESSNYLTDELGNRLTG